MRNAPPQKQAGTKTGPRRIAGQLCLDFRAASELTGLSEKSLRARVRRQIIPYRKLGGRVFFSREDLIAFFGALPGVSLEQARANAEARAEH